MSKALELMGQLKIKIKETAYKMSLPPDIITTTTTLQLQYNNLDIYRGLCYNLQLPRRYVKVLIQSSLFSCWPVEQLCKLGLPPPVSTWTTP